jgi:excisionase family DNA binding protein
VTQTNDFFSFEEALEALRLKEEELKRLVSEGEIRAFREGETMKLRRRDVEALRSELLGDEVVEMGSATEELVFEDEVELADPGMATAELSSAPTLLDDELDIEELAIEEIDEDADERELVAAGAAVGARGRAAEEPTRDGGLVALLLVNTVVFVLIMPVAFALRSGVVSDFARAVAGLFTDMGKAG